MSHYTRSKVSKDASVLREGDVVPDDVPSVTSIVRCKIKAERGPESMSAELAGPESVPFGGGPGSFGSADPLPAEATLGGSDGLADPTAVTIAPELSEVLPPAVAFQPLPLLLSGTLWKVY